MVAVDHQRGYHGGWPRPDVVGPAPARRHLLVDGVQQPSRWRRDFPIPCDGIDRFISSSSLVVARCAANPRGLGGDPFSRSCAMAGCVRAVDRSAVGANCPPCIGDRACAASWIGGPRNVTVRAAILLSERRSSWLAKARRRRPRRSGRTGCDSTSVPHRWRRCGRRIAPVKEKRRVHGRGARGT